MKFQKKCATMNFFVVIFVITVGILDMAAGFLECSSDADCVVENSKCENNICSCSKGLIMNTHETECLPVVVGFNASCSDDNQCAWLLGKYVCNEGKCNCDRNWLYYKGRCHKMAGLNEDCINDETCWNGYDPLAMVCKEGSCKCSDDYYLRGEYDCRPKSQNGEYCSLDSDCFGTHKQCIGSKCAAKPKPEFSFEEPRLLTPVRILQEVPDAECDSDDQCPGENRMCYQFTKKCICKRGYFFKSDIDGCVGEIGTNIDCNTDSNCVIDYTVCLKGSCVCRKSYFYLPDHHFCQKPTTQEVDFCNNKERCYVYGKNVTCNNNECYCLLCNNLDKEFICRYDKDSCQTTNGCNTNDDCAKIKNQVCIEQTCQCPKNYRLEKDICLPNIGAACDDEDKPCTIANSLCKKETCVCENKYVANGTSSCVKQSSGLSSPCLIDVQCTSIVKNSECKNKTCGCIGGFKMDQKECLQEKYMHEVCTSARQCHVSLGKNVQCRNGMCQCSADMKLNSDMTDCTSGSSRLLLKFYISSLIVVLLTSFK